jgi:uncharacterized protein (TIGR02757 family)
MSSQQKLKTFLNDKVQRYNAPHFITDDPITIPHRFTEKQDIEIAGFFAAILAWGNRKSIIQSCNALLQRMDNAPYQFCQQHRPADLKRLLGFKHRTFNEADLLGLVRFFHRHYAQHASLEPAFAQWMGPGDATVEKGLAGFHNYVFEHEGDIEQRTRKHIATPAKKSACKRLNMYLRWMVRHDKKGVDFGLWKKIKPAQLVCPLDVHVARVARKLGLLQRQQNDWEAALELTANLRLLDAKDPVQYDFALFGLGVVEKM